MRKSGVPGPQHNLGGPLSKALPLRKTPTYAHTQPHRHPQIHTQNKAEICIQTATLSIHSIHRSHTQTYSHAGSQAHHTHTYTPTLMYKCSYPHVCTHSHSCTKTAQCPDTPTLVHLHTHAQAITHMLSHHTHPKPFTHIKTLTNSECTHTLQNVQSFTDLDILGCPCAHAHTRTHILKLMHTHMLVYIPTRAQTLQHTWTHTQDACPHT